jgi:very-short-patch-repair endonuclease
VLLGDALNAAGIRGLVRQFSIDLPGYGPARFDLAVPELRSAIEIDIFPTHSETAGRESDEWRDRCALELGWVVDRVVEADFGPSLDLTVHRILSSHRQRRSSLR